jgi:hypothetical protein
MRNRFVRRGYAALLVLMVAFASVEILFEEGRGEDECACLCACGCPHAQTAVVSACAASSGIALLVQPLSAQPSFPAPDYLLPPPFRPPRV